MLFEKLNCKVSLGLDGSSVLQKNKTKQKHIVYHKCSESAKITHPSFHNTFYPVFDSERT